MLTDADSPNPPAHCRYQQALSRRGLHKTALEVCKLLLALNSDDPMGALFALDYLAGEGWAWHLAFPSLPIPSVETCTALSSLDYLS